MKTQGIKEKLERIREGITLQGYNARTAKETLPKIKGTLEDVDALIAIACEIEAAHARAMLVDKVFAVSHYTRPMAARVLGVSLSSIHERVKRGTMKSETIEGEVLIPAWAVAQAIEKKEKK